MIRLIPGEWRDRYPRLIDEMHRLRRSVFHERLKWQVTVINRWEIDGYDALDPLYVLSLDEDERVIGGLRLLPTTGFNMLNDTFPQLLPDGARIESPLIWESSRFTVRMTGDTRVDVPTISRATAELGLALNEIGKAASLTHIVTVYDRVMHRMLMRCGCAGEPLGPPQMIGGVETYAVLYEVGPGWDARVRNLARGGERDARAGSHQEHAGAVGVLNTKPSDGKIRRGQRMIRFITYRNFPLLDVQIERDYRRRCNGDAVAVLAEIEEVEFVGSLRRVRRGSRRSRDWLLSLAREMDALSKTPETLPSRPSSSRLIAANATHRTTGKARLRGARR